MTGALFKVERTEQGIADFLNEIGRVFRVFDKQGSGCVSYGVTAEGAKWFVKHSGKPESIGWMNQAIRFNADIRHRCLPRLRHAFDTADGRAIVYDWVEGEVLGSPDYPGADGRNRPESPHRRFRQLPAERIVAMLTDLYELHTEIESKGYVAVDFYDGCILYDFETHRTHFCDFDMYSKGPFRLQLERNYGSSRFMAPEEFRKGSLIDWRTTVYTMGAAAFVFLADGERNRAAWKASDKLYETALRAVSEHPGERFGSVGELYREWIAALQDGKGEGATS